MDPLRIASSLDPSTVPGTQHYGGSSHVRSSGGTFRAQPLVRDHTLRPLPKSLIASPCWHANHAGRPVSSLIQVAAERASLLVVDANWVGLRVFDIITHVGLLISSTKAPDSSRYRGVSYSLILSFF